MFDIKRKNGVFRGFSLDSGGKKAFKRVKDWGNQPVGKALGTDRGPKMSIDGPKISGIRVSQKPRKNGVWQGVSITSDKKTKAKAAAARRSSTPSNAVDAQRKMDSNRNTTSARKRMVQSAAASKAKNMDRSERKRRGDYKGKYYGPDVFKGNQQKIDAWKKAGKPRDSKGRAVSSDKSEAPKTANTGR